MSRYLLALWFLFFIPLLLDGQTQTLPDISISGESAVKPHLKKRSLPFPETKTNPDSLSGLLPRSLDLPLPDTRPVPINHHGFLKAEVNSDLGFSTYLSFYPRLALLRRISHQFDYQVPQFHTITDTRYLKHSFAAGMAISDSVSLVAKADYQDSDRYNYAAKLWEFSLDSHVPLLPLGNLRFRELTLQAAYSDLQQQLLTNESETADLNFMLSSKAQYRWLDIKSKYQYSYGVGGVYIAPALKWEPLGIKELRAAFIADSDQLIPSLEFHSRTALSDGLSFIIANDPALGASTRFDQLNRHPWLQLDKHLQLSKIPLDLTASLELLKAGSNIHSSSRFILSNHLTYSLDASILKSSSVFGVAAIDYADIIHNSTSFSLLIRKRNLVWRQAANVDLAYIAEHDYYRAPYIPMFIVDTYLGYTFRRLQVEAAFIQHYNTHNHLGNSLPEALIFNLGVEYRIRRSILYLALNNLLDKQQYLFSEYPASGVNLLAGFKQRF